MAVEPVTDAPRSGEAAQAPDAVVLDRVTRRYGERAALHAVSLRIRSGTTVAVFGPNGAGKTTLLRMLATLLVPHEGVLTVLGHHLPRDAHLVRPRVGLLGHDPLLYRDLSARENLRFYARLYDVEQPDARIAHLLETTGMTARAGDPVHTLSRGMQQRIGICRAVLHRPELLLLDEPRAHLDPEAAAMVDPLIGPHSATTRVLVTHDIEHGLTEADHVMGLRDGEKVMDAPATELQPRHVRSLYGVAS